ncbi:CsgG/HfaB family protein [Psittacicella gerlachiana]|uniref:Curli production assembly/transport component CsgG n=1 Tax=Psittacicella gerlachiana TaxID=2028574 RepID=A0A3A1Y4N8_9GAMM|nr:CsgG/HfaB family protein [Psittacicella gerlachiana]RIY32535.1 hypothetical protein CKF59_06890 [Psittacicella gerlachiana]
MKRIISLLLVVTSSVFLSSCISNTVSVVKQEEQGVVIKQNQTNTKPLSVAIARFENKSDYNSGVFANSSLAQQGLDTLVQTMTQSGYYQVMNRSLIQFANYESELNGYQFKAEGARYLVSAAITEFGRRSETRQVLYGLAGKSKSEIAYATVVINLIDTRNGAVVLSTTGTTQIDITGTRVLGSGGYVSYDSTQMQRVLTLAIREAVNNLTTETLNRNLHN